VGIVVGPAAIGVGSGIACALLAFWLVASRPGLGPQTLRGCLAAAAGAFGLLVFLGPAMDVAIGVGGTPAGLLAVADPILAFSFWSGALLVRAFVGRAAHGST
jgi:hypothetical protein